MRLSSIDGRRAAAVLFLGLLAAASACAQADERAALDRLQIDAGRALVDAGAGDWAAVRASLDDLAARWKDLSASGAPAAEVDRALLAANRALSSAPAGSGELRDELPRLARALDAYVSSSGGGSPAAADRARQVLLESARAAQRFAAKGDLQRASAQVTAFSRDWRGLEAEIRAHDPQMYARVEIALSQAGASLRAEPQDGPGAVRGLDSIVAALGAAPGAGPAGAAVAGALPAAPPASIADLQELLRTCGTALERGDRAAASEAMRSFTEGWPSAEGQVMARSAQSYSRVEAAMTEVQALLLSPAGDPRRTQGLLDDMADELAAVAGKTSYTFWDSAIILLREGLEALLILATLLALLRKAQQPRSAGWVWAGAGGGAALSAALAVVVGLVLTGSVAGAARERVEGFVGLASVALMLTVGAWLHRRSGIQSWNAYLKSRVGGALASGNMWSVAALACLAVLREGAETVVFYAGIAPSISLAELVGGIGAALVVLVIVGFLIIRFGIRLPLHWFFLAATLLIYYLAVKIAGESVHALQVAGTVPSTAHQGLPAAGAAGMYATWETFAVQGVILLLVLTELAVTEWRQRVARRAPGHEVRPGRA